MALPSNSERVRRHTADHINRAIRERMEDSVAYYRTHPEEIGARLQELDREWDIERSLEANAAALVLIGSALGFTAGRKFFAIPLAVGGFLLQHAVQGWCPPLPLLRRLGFRTELEIQIERDALNNLRRAPH